ncbi:MAG: M50 family metallopeptidase [Ilumatobacteraceae bacterium]
MSDSRVERLSNEVVSGGSHRPDDPPAAPTRSAVVIGTLAWVLLLGSLWVSSPWMLVFVAGLAASIMLHELGHFWTARRSGMKATQFFLGFGPRIWSIHRNGVEYGVRAVPLGGFVRIICMTNLDEVPADDEPRTYRQATYARRMWVITAGSVMHLIIAITTIVGVYAVWGRVEETGQVTVSGVDDDTPAAAAGFLADDVVLAVDGHSVATSADFRSLLAGLDPGTTHRFDVQRGDDVIELSATLTTHPADLAADPPVDDPRGYLGVSSWSVDRVPQGAGDVLVEGPRDLVVGVGQAVVGVAKVINPVNVWGHLVGSNDDLSSRPGTIVGATRISERAGEFDGWAGVLSLLAAVNVSVGVFNMFPLLPLDGGHAAIATYERLRSRRGQRYRADISKLMPVAAVCIALLAFMFLTGLYLDTLQF